MAYKLRDVNFLNDIQEFFSIGKWSGVAPVLDSKKIYYILELMTIYKKIKAIAKKKGFSAYLSSAYREKAHNEKAGGKSNSQHQYCEAIDVSIPNVKEFVASCVPEITEVLKEHFVLQVITYDWGIHFSIQTERSTKEGIRFLNQLLP